MSVNEGVTRAPASFIRLGARAVIVLLGLYGLALNLGVFEGRFDPHALTFYTILSNLYVVVYYAADLVFLWRGREAVSTTWLPRWKGSVIVAILLTFLVYHLLLAPLYIDLPGYDFFAPDNIIPHYVMGPVVLLDWLLLDRKGCFRAVDPLAWTAVPLLYLTFALVRVPFIGYIYGGGTSRFPYPFLDMDERGVLPVIVTIVAISVGFIAAGYLLYGLDRGLARPWLRRPEVSTDAGPADLPR